MPIKGLNRGFTLLEAIVAMVLLSMVGMAIFSWLNTNLNSVTRIENRLQKASIVRNVSSFISTINPMLIPAGEITLGGYSVQWESEAVDPIKDNVSRFGGKGLYEIGLYDTQVIVRDINDESIEYSMRTLGYLQVRNTIDGIF